MLHWEKNRAMSLESLRKSSGTLTISGFNNAQGPRLAASRTHGAGGSGGPGGGGYWGGAHLGGPAGGGGGPLGGGPLGGCGLSGGRTGSWGAPDGPAPLPPAAAAKSPRRPLRAWWSISAGVRIARLRRCVTRFPSQVFGYGGPLGRHWWFIIHRLRCIRERG